MKLHVAVGIIIKPENQILISERPAHTYKGGLWEFPGGKVEVGEDIYKALQRELREELDIEVVKAEPWLKFDYDYNDRFVTLDVWKVTQFNGEPRGAEQQKILWIPIADLNKYEFPQGNKPICEKLLKEIF